MALCSLSTGSSGTPRRRAAAVTSSPAMTSTSLFASAIVFPASIAASTASSAAVPDDAQGDELGVGEAGGVESGAVEAGHGAGRGVQLEADEVFEAGALFHAPNGSPQFSCVQLNCADGHTTIRR